MFLAEVHLEKSLVKLEHSFEGEERDTWHVLMMISWLAYGTCILDFLDNYSPFSEILRNENLIHR